MKDLLATLEGRAQQQRSDTNVIEAAELQLAITVGHALLQQDVMLLPEAYRMFCSTAAGLATARGIPNFNQPTKQSIQSYLLSALGHHLSYTCKQRRTGVLLYRTGGDLLHTISKLLGKEKTVNDITVAKSTEEPVNSDEKIYDSMTTVIHQQIGKFLADGTEKPNNV